MKTALLVLAGSVLISISTISLAGCCNSCGTSACEQPNPITSECNCTDPGATRNTCMSKEKYCEAFGNVGRD